MIALFALILAASPLDSARAHLKAQNPDALALDLSDDVALPPADVRTAAGLLVEGSKAAQKKKDKELALLLAQMAHRRDAKSVEALAQLSALARADEQFGEAEKWAEAWRKLAPDDPHAALERARIAAGEGDWDGVRQLGSSIAQGKGLSAEEQKEAKALVNRAGAPASTITTSASVEAKLRAAAEAAARERDQAFGNAPAQAPSGGSDVVIYGTSWCHYCKLARSYLKTKGVPFEDKDIEADPDAAEELMRKAKSAGIHPGGVPVIDVRGTLVEGFDRSRIDALLSQ